MPADRVRESIAEILKQSETSDDVPPYRILPEGHDAWCKIKATRILSLPSGIEAVKKCEHCDGKGFYGGKGANPYTLCPKCKSGTISRDVPIGELREWAISMIEFCESHSIYAKNPDKQALVLKTGEILRVKAGVSIRF